MARPAASLAMVIAVIVADGGMVRFPSHQYHNEGGTMDVLKRQVQMAGLVVAAGFVAVAAGFVIG